MTERSVQPPIETSVRIAVLGLFNSGSSALAGILHYLGVNMGPPYQRDHFEPLDLANYLSHCWNEPDIRENVARSERVQALARWITLQETRGVKFVGAKHPLLCLCAEDIVSAWGPQTRFIWAHRPLQDSITGLQNRAWPRFVGKEVEVQQHLWDCIQSFFAEHEHLQISFADVLSNPGAQIARITEFLGLEPDVRRVAQAVQSVRPKNPSRVSAHTAANKPLSPLISFCTVMMDRFDHLQATFLQNIRENQGYPRCEFLLLNYSCPDPRTEAWAKDGLASLIADGTVTYYYFPDASEFSHSHSKNMAFRLASGDILCNIDADNFAGPDFADEVVSVLDAGPFFVRGPADRRGLAGRICVRRDHWFEVGGYDERFSGWGSEDSDLADRLRLLNLRQANFRNPMFCRTVPHSDELRVQHMAEQDKRQSNTQNRTLRMENLLERTVKPNGEKFGCGKVQKNFGEWIELD